MNLLSNLTAGLLHNGAEKLGIYIRITYDHRPLGVLMDPDEPTGILECFLE